MDRAFGKYNRKATEEAFKKYLLEWKKYRLKALQKMPTVGSPSMDGQPNDGTPHDPDAKWASYSDEMRACREREFSCTKLSFIGEDAAVLGDLLLHRYIKQWGATRTMMYINDKYQDKIPDWQNWEAWTMNRKTHEALFLGALCCKNESVRILK